MAESLEKLKSDTNQFFLDLLIYPDFKDEKRNFFVEGGNQTIVNAILRVSI